MVRASGSGDEQSPGLWEFNVEAKEKHCNICDRPGVYVVVYGINFKVRYCWSCLPKEQREYLRRNY